MNSEKIWTLALIGILLFGAIGIASSTEEVLPEIVSVLDEQEPSEGGDSLETAVEIQPENYAAWNNIPTPLNKREYFKIVVEAGQMLIVTVTNPTEETFDIVSNTILYDENGEVLIPNHENPLYNMSSAGKSGRYCWLPSSEKSLYTYYISVGGSIPTRGGTIGKFIGDGTSYFLIFERDSTILMPINSPMYNVSIEDNFDAGSQTDAGDRFEIAMDITQGKYKGYLSGKWGTDKKDLYKMHVEKGKILTVKVTPPSDKTRGLTIYDGDGGVITEEHPLNPGAIVKTEKEITSSGDLYIEITSDDDYGEYVLDLEIATEAGTPTKDSTEAETPPKDSKAPGFGAVFVITGILIVFYLLRRKK